MKQRNCRNEAAVIVILSLLSLGVHRLGLKLPGDSMKSMALLPSPPISPGKIDLTSS
jgi:hypothetical protein